MALSNKTTIGLDEKSCDIVATELNSLLADYQVFYMNVRAFHWNIKGDNFFDLHERFEILYTDLLMKIDEIGERILAFGEVPMHRYSDYIAASNIAEKDYISDGIVMGQSIAKSLMELIVKQRRISYISKENDDEGTYQMMSNFIKEQEKQMWMYNAFLGK